VDWGWRGVGAGAVALAVGIGIGASVGATLARASATSAALPSSSPEKIGRWTAGPPKMLDVSKRQQVATDMPATAVSGTELSSDTFRLLSGSPSVNPSAPSVYAVRNTAGSPCMLLIAGDTRQTTIS